MPKTHNLGVDHLAALSLLGAGWLARWVPRYEPDRERAAYPSTPRQT